MKFSIKTHRNCAQITEEKLLVTINLTRQWIEKVNCYTLHKRLLRVADTMQKNSYETFVFEKLRKIDWKMKMSGISEWDQSFKVRLTLIELVSGLKFKLWTIPRFILGKMAAFLKSWINRWRVSFNFQIKYQIFFDESQLEELVWLLKS